MAEFHGGRPVGTAEKDWPGTVLAVEEIVDALHRDLSCA
jgi:hypothetical protein